MPSFTFVSSLPASGEMGRRIRQADWSKTSVGARAAWPAALRVALEVALLSRIPCYIAWGSAHALFYNDAFAPMLGSKHPQALGMSVPEVWPDAWGDLRRIFEQARACQPFLVRNQHSPTAPDATAGTDFYTSSYVPLFKAPGIVGGVLCICIKTASDERAGGHADFDAERLRELLMTTPSFMNVLRGPEHILEIANERSLEMLGHRDGVGKPIRAAFPELEGQGYFDMLDRVYRTGQTLYTRQASIRFQRPDAPAPEEHIVDFVYQPIRGADGHVDGVFVHGTDVSDAVRANERRQSAFDALPQSIAVIDESGLILAVNRAWREYEQQDGAAADRGVEGVNYLEGCERASAGGDAICGRIAALIRDVVSRKRKTAEYLYPRDDMDDGRWFRVSIRAFNERSAPRIVLIREDVSEQRRHEQRIDHLATHDQLTGLPNRALLQHRIELAIEKVRGTGLGVALLFLDLDHFKRVNDLYGRDGGDEALRKVAATLRSVVRATDTVARLSGDEFVVLLGDVRDSQTTATVIARLISERLATALHVDHRDVPISASIGISLYPADGLTSDHLLRSADMAMHSAKAAGRHTSRFYSPDLGARAAQRVQLEADLREALASGQFRLVYQPQFNMLTGGIVGAEALIRWRHPTRGDVSPQEFIPLSEETGLIVDIGAWVLRTACREAANWLGRSLKRVAVNISAIQLQRGDFVDLVTDILDETGFDPRCLDLEITESMLLADKGDALARLKALREIGVSLTLDDFGTGYSNLGYLTRFPIDRLKIDRSFVQGLPNERSPASIVGAIVGLSRGLRLDLIAEGVETAEQASFLLEAGCEKAQGFFLSLPLPSEEMVELLAGAERSHDGG